jgi:hypothetical protein
MVTRCYLTVVSLCWLLVIPSALADIYRWDTGEVIPGTEGIEPEAGLQLLGMDLSYAELPDAYLDRANFNGSDLRFAVFRNAVLTNADLSRTTLMGLLRSNCIPHTLTSRTC